MRIEVKEAWHVRERLLLKYASEAEGSDEVANELVFIHYVLIMEWVTEALTVLL